jgi:protein TonB
MNSRPIVRFVHKLLGRVWVATGAAAMTLGCFMVLPLMQMISKRPETDTLVRTVEAAEVPPPPAIEEQPEEKPKDEPKPPELTEDAPPLDLSQLELALGTGLGGDWLGGDFAVSLKTLTAGGGGDAETLFSMADLDQAPRTIYQPGPVLTAELRRKAPGTVNIIFIVDERGRTESPIVQSSSDPIFEAPALAAVKQWKFEPGKRNGQPVRFRMRVPISFPKGR